MSRPFRLGFSCLLAATCLGFSTSAFADSGTQSQIFVDGVGGGEAFSVLPNEEISLTGSARNVASVPCGSVSGSCDVPYGPTASGDAYARSEIGANHLSVRGSYVYSTLAPANARAATFAAGVSASAFSTWYDTWNVTGTPSTGPITVTLRGSIDYDVVVHGNFWESGPQMLGMYGYEFRLKVGPYDDAVKLTRPDFDGSGPLTWEYSMQWDGGPLFVYSTFSAFAGRVGAGGGCSECTGSVLFDAANTARFDLIQVSDGATIESASGLLKTLPNGQGFYYELSPVPEPSSLLLFAMGALALGARRALGSEAQKHVPARGA